MTLRNPVADAQLVRSTMEALGRVASNLRSGAVEADEAAQIIYAAMFDLGTVADALEAEARPG